MPFGESFAWKEYRFRPYQAAMFIRFFKAMFRPLAPARTALDGWKTIRAYVLEEPAVGAQRICCGHYPRVGYGPTRQYMVLLELLCRGLVRVDIGVLSLVPNLSTSRNPVTK